MKMDDVGAYRLELNRKEMNLICRCLFHATLKDEQDNVAARSLNEEILRVRLRLNAHEQGVLTQKLHTLMEGR